MAFKTKLQVLKESLQAKGTKIESVSKEKINGTVEKDLREYRFENQKKIRESQEEIATIILNA